MLFQWGSQLSQRASIFLSRGRAYLTAGDRLMETDAAFIDLFDPLATLFLFSIEISLKACLVHANGENPNRHFIGQFLISAIESGLKVGSEDVEVIVMATTAYELHAPRYAPVKQTVSTPSIHTLQATARNVSERCIAFVRGSADDYSAAISLEDAIAMRDRVMANYQAGVRDFDPAKVWPADSTDLPYPLGTVIQTKFKEP